MKSGTILLTEKVFSSIPYPPKIGNAEVNFDEVIDIIEQIIKPKYLNKVQILILEYTWQGLSYAKIANLTNYDFGYVKDTGSKLWQMLSESFGQKITKQNVQLIFYRYVRQRGRKYYPTFTPSRTNFF